jgi:2-dehydro-3-deoxyphosphogalactonate aldolase
MTSSFRTHLARHPHVAILRGLTVADAAMVTDTLLDAGWRTIEVPLNRPGAREALDVVARQAKGSGAIIGAGTITTIAECEEAEAAGAEFFLSPHTDPDLVALATGKGLTYVPGCQTVGEMVTAISAGATILKLFPFGHLGADFTDAVREVVSPDIHLMAVGGITPETVSEAMPPADSVGVGSSLYTPGIDRSTLGARARMWPMVRNIST